MTFFFVLDEQGNIIHVNSTVIKRLGYAREEIVGNPVLMVHPPESIDEVNKIMGEILSGRMEFCPIPIVTKSGIRIPVETRVSHGIWNGRPALFGVTKDISKIKLSEEKFSKIFHLNPSACGLSDLDNQQYIELNDAFYRLFGFTEDEVIGKTPMDLGIMTPEARSELLLKSDSNGKITNVETELKAKNGYIKHVLMSSENIYVQDKKYRFTIVHDITDRKEAQEQLRESEQRLRAIYETSPDPIGLFDAQANILLMNQAAVKTFGYQTAQEMVGMNAMEFFLPEDRESMKMNNMKVLETGSQLNLEYRLLKKDGTLFPAQFSCAALYGANGAPSGIVAITRDISEAKRTEEALLKYRDHLEEMVRERTEESEIKTMALQQTNTALKVLLQQREYDKKDMEERFVNNLRTFVLPNIEEMKKAKLDARQQSFLGIIETHINEIASPMLKNIRQFNLTPKETKIAALIKQDKSTKEIAEILKISSGSIDVHRKNIRKKLGLTNRKANLSSYLKNLE